MEIFITGYSAAYLLGLQFRATPKISFYKFSLQWPPATCHGTLSCKPPIPLDFKIYGIWPQDKNDIPIPPYSKSNRCTRKRPTRPEDLPKKLGKIERELESRWPNLRDAHNKAAIGTHPHSANYRFWKYEWKMHGTCSDYPTDPLQYFNSALKLKRGLKTIVRFRPGTKKTVQEFVDEVFDVLKAYPEIACNENPSRTRKQLWEIRLCYDKPKPGKLPKKLLNCIHQLPEKNSLFRTS
ncbi:hypothetical protein ES288_A10G172200v1 [Gossypium darwinii]|uniref:Uncharacterized protein n=1 Tax=Gossypium darwinii TaxID=34276 RepID=A0A5D2EZC3_GOSDA|nr:hypothetical protein ES288_A10G172200v1 [Gossypium darwinii]